MLRADQVLMGGVVLLGGYAVYRLLSAKPEPEAAPAGGGTPALPPAPPTPALPPSGTLPQNVVHQGLATLRNGQVYRGRIEMLAPGFGALDVSAALRAYGLDPLALYLTPKEARDAGILPQAIGDAPPPTSAWFRARFSQGAAGSVVRTSLARHGQPAITLLWASFSDADAIKGTPTPDAMGGWSFACGHGGQPLVPGSPWERAFWPSYLPPMWRAR